MSPIDQSAAARGTRALRPHSADSFADVRRRHSGLLVLDGTGDRALGCNTIELRKQFAEEEKTSQTEKAAATLKEINQTQALIDLEKKRTENLEKRLKLYEEFGLNPSRGNLSSVRDARSAEALMNSLLNPGRGGAPDIGIGSGPSTTNYLAGIVSPAGKPPLNAADLLAQINKEHEDLFRSQASIDAEHYQDELDSLNEPLKKQLISQQEYSKQLWLSDFQFYPHSYKDEDD